MLSHSMSGFVKHRADARWANRLALIEMRLFLARLFWRFDLTLQPESNKWISDPDAVVRMLRAKTPLMVKLTPRFGTKSEGFPNHIPVTSEIPN